MTEEKDKSQTTVSRPPIVVVLGHVDSGKTTLIDKVRETHVADKESGGITQHVGAYEVVLPSEAEPDILLRQSADQDDRACTITFIDTPGHEAFSAMRSRGAKVADIAILVVDAVQGVQPQTKEAISHIKKSGIGLIVALNKIDLPQAQPDRVKEQLMKEGVQAESFGGKIPCVEVSAKTGKGLDQLLEMILLVAEMENLQADQTKAAEGVVIEAYLDNLRGPIATILVRDGVLKIGDILGTPTAFGKVKGLEDFQAKLIKKVFPSMPVIVLGFEQVPAVGDKIKVFPDLEEAKQYLEKKERKAGGGKVILPEEGKTILNLILKADVQGSLEAISAVLDALPQEKVILRLLQKSVGEIAETDVKLAQASKAVILGFRVKENPTAQILKDRAGVKILPFDIIYDLAQGVRHLMERELEPEIEIKKVGKVKILQLFMTDKNRQIIGGKVLEGEVRRGTKIEVWRNEELLGQGRLLSLQENKKDADSVPKNRECGMLFEGEIKIQEGDILEFSQEERKRAEL